MHSSAEKRSVMDITSLLNDAVEEPIMNQGNNPSSRPDPIALAFRERKLAMSVTEVPATATARCRTSSQSRQPSGSGATASQERREGRPAYPREHAAFLWYQKDDLDCDWDEVTMRYRTQFGTMRRKNGLQCKYYRIRGEIGAPPVRPSRKGGRDPHQDPIHCMFPVLSMKEI